MKYSQTKLNKDILSAIKKVGYEDMTPIQERAIPAVIEGKDMIACAQTGTGKTAAFALPILHMLAGEQRKTPRALVVTPTRELAQQIFDNFKKYGRYLKLRCACIYGGASQNVQIEKLKRGYDILIATPGRLLDFESRGILSLDQIEILVLDEADCMMDMGFIPDIRKIEKLVPPEHQTLLFSATMPKEIEALARDFLTDPVDIRVAATSSPADTVEQRICFVNRADKKYVLKSFLERKEVKKSIVFTRTKHGADRLVRDLDKEGIRSMAIHGDKTQGQRKNALERFRSGNVKVLVATDVASRGIDIPKISHVFNYDLPDEAESYIHRIGRAGRAGHTGEAITMCTQDDVSLLRDIERLVKKEIPEEMTEWTVTVDKNLNVPHPRKRSKKGAGQQPRRQGARAGRQGTSVGRQAASADNASRKTLKATIAKGARKAVGTAAAQESDRFAGSSQKMSQKNRSKQSPAERQRKFIKKPGTDRMNRPVKKSTNGGKGNSKKVSQVI